MSRKINYTTIPRDGLVGEWLLDGNANDISGNGNNGTEKDITYVGADKGYVSQCASFNGTSSNVTGAISDYSDVFTISVWVNTTSTNQEAVYTNYNGSDNSNRHLIILNRDNNSDDNAGYITIYIDNGSNSGQISSKTNVNINDGNWQYIVYIKNSSNNEGIYINGKQIETNGATSSGDITDTHYLIGDDNNNTEYFDGNIGLTRIYNRVLSQSEINNLYQEGLRRLGPIRGLKNNDIFVGSLPNLEEGKVLEISKSQVSGTYYDQTGNGNNGTATDVSDNQVGQINVMSFNGSSSKANTNKTINVKNITMCGWFKYNSYTQTSNNGGLDLTTSESDDYNRISIRVDNDDNYWLCDIYGTSYSQDSRITLTPKPDLGIRNFVCATYDYDNDIFTIYINGIQIGQNTGINFKLDSGYKELKMAYGTDNNGNNFIFADVDIGLPIIYNRVLSSEEIQQLYYLQKGNFIN